MKKGIIALVFLLLCCAVQAKATTYYAQAGSGNMSGLEWDTSAGGGGTDLVWANRQAGDVFDANAQTGIVIDTDPGVGTSQVVLTTGASGGGFIINGTMTVTAHITAGITTCVTFGTGTFTVTMSGDIAGSATTASAYGLNTTSNGKTINLTGDVTGGAAAVGINSANTSTIAVTGNVTGGGAAFYGIQTTTGTVTVSGTATGGSGAAAHGVYCASGSSGTVTVVNATGGTGIGAAGIRSLSSNASTVTGNITNSATAEGASGRITYTPAAATNYISYASTSAEYANVTATDVKSGVAYGSKTGSLASSGGGAWAQ